MGDAVKRALGGVLVFLVVGAGFAWFKLRPPPPPSGSNEARVNVLSLCAGVSSALSMGTALESVAPWPAEVPRGVAVPWVRTAAFEPFDFEPGATVRFQYAVEVHENPVGEREIRCVARGDLDGDGQVSEFRVKLDPDGMTTPVEVTREAE